MWVCVVGEGDVGVWWCVVVCGGVWWCVVVCGGVWWCVVVCGGVWCVVVCVDRGCGMSVLCVVVCCAVSLCVAVAAGGGVHVCVVCGVWRGLALGNPLCVDSKRLRVYVHDVSVCTGKTTQPATNDGGSRSNFA